jgi:hypothetical protein
VLYDRQAKAGAPHLTRTRPIDAVKTFEKPFEVLRRNPVTVICHEDAVPAS